MITLTELVRTYPLGKYSEDPVVELLNSIIEQGGEFIRFGRLDDRDIKHLEDRYSTPPYEVDQVRIERGLCLDYKLNGKSMRFIMGYTELGDWVEHNDETEIDPLIENLF